MTIRRVDICRIQELTTAQLIAASVLTPADSLLSGDIIILAGRFVRIGTVSVGDPLVTVNAATVVPVASLWTDVVEAASGVVWQVQPTGYEDLIITAIEWSTINFSVLSIPLLADICSLEAEDSAARIRNVAL